MSKETGMLEMLRQIGMTAVRLENSGIPRAQAQEQAAQKTLARSAHKKEVLTGLAELGSLWCSSGFPNMEVSQKLAASFACTKFSTEQAKQIKLPWDCFTIRFTGIIPEITTIMVAKNSEGVVHCMGIGPDKFLIMCTQSLHEYADAEVPNIMIAHRPETMEEDIQQAATSANERVTRLCSRILLGACVEITGFEREIAKGRPPGKRSSKKKRGVDTPTTWEFRLTRSVKLDARPVVKEYLEGKHGAGFSLQHCVCGHWKWQAHGPGHTKRKWIHVEPYWRGPEDAPIALRSHEL